MNRFSAIWMWLLLLFAAPAIWSQQNAQQGIDLYSNGQYRDAIQVLSCEVKQEGNERNAELWNYLGLSYLAVSEYRNAIEPFGKAIDISPVTSAYHSNLAMAYVFMRRIATARIVVEKAIELDLKNYNAYYVRGMANFWDSKFDEAKADATRAIEIDETFAAGYVLVSDVYIAELSNKLTAGSSIKAEIGLLNAAADILKVGKEKREGKPSDALFDAAYESTIAFYEYISKNTAIISDAKDLPDPNVTPL